MNNWKYRLENGVQEGCGIMKWWKLLVSFGMGPGDVLLRYHPVVQLWDKGDGSTFRETISRHFQAVNPCQCVCNVLWRVCSPGGSGVDICVWRCTYALGFDRAVVRSVQSCCPYGEVDVQGVYWVCGLLCVVFWCIFIDLSNIITPPVLKTFQGPHCRGCASLTPDQTPVCGSVIHIEEISPILCGIQFYNELSFQNPRCSDVVSIRTATLARVSSGRYKAKCKTQSAQSVPILFPNYQQRSERK